MEGLKRNIDLEQKLLGAARLKSDRANEVLANLDRDMQEKTREDAPGGTGSFVAKDRGGPRAVPRSPDGEPHLHRPDRPVAGRAGRLAGRADGRPPRRRSETLRGRGRRAKTGLAAKPVHARQPGPRLLAHGPRILLVLGGMLVLHRLVRLLSRRIVQVMVRHGSRQSQQDRVNRAQTLVSVFRNTAALVILGGGTLVVLQEVGIPVVPLMGGAAVVGLAVAFGART